MRRSGKRKMEKRKKGLEPNRSTKRHRKWITRVVLLLLTVGGIAAWQWWPYKPAPSFTLKSSDGQLIALSDYRGKQEVVIIFYMGAG